MSMPPGPSLPPLLQTLSFVAAPVGWGTGLWKRYGDVYTVRDAVFGTQVLIADPELVRQIFTGDPAVYHAGEANRALLMLLGDRSVLLLDGPEHLRQRRLLLPPFHGERMTAYAGIMQTIAERAIDRWREGETFSLHPTMQKVTLDIILHTVFGLERGPRHDELSARLTTLFDRVQSPLGMLMMIPALQRDLGRLSPWAGFLRDRAAADAVLYAEIAERRAELAAPPSTARPRRDDVLSLLLEARDEQGEGLTDKDLRDELMTLLAAGHETTATAVCWAFERILDHPAIEVRLRAEIEAVAPGRPLTPEDLPRLEYLDATIKEVLRLRPVIPGVGRKLTAPIKLGRWDIPAGTLVVPSIYRIHRREDLYPDAERFDPDRFLGKKTDPYTFFPFGGGVRRCIGMAFALQEMKIVIAAVLRRSRLRLPRRGPLGVQLRSFVFAPKGGPKVVFERRLDALSCSRPPPPPAAPS